MVSLENLGTLFRLFKAVWTNSTAACMDTGVEAALVGITLRQNLCFFLLAEVCVDKDSRKIASLFMNSS